MASKLGARRRRPRKPRGVKYPTHFDASPGVVCVSQQGSGGTNWYVSFRTEVEVSPLFEATGWTIAGQAILSVTVVGPTVINIDVPETADPGAQFIFPATTLIRSLSGQTFKQASGNIG